MSELERLARAISMEFQFADIGHYEDDPRYGRCFVSNGAQTDELVRCSEKAARAILRELRPPNINRKLLLKANAVDIVRYDGDSETVFHATGNEIEEIFEVVIDHILSEGSDGQT